MIVHLGDTTVGGDDNNMATGTGIDTTWSDRLSSAFSGGKELILYAAVAFLVFNAITSSGGKKKRRR